MNLKNMIKSKCAEKGWTMGKLVEELNKKYNRNDSQQNLTQKISRNTIKFREVLEIVDILGYELKWIEKED